MEEQSLTELNLRSAFCSYLCAAVCTFLARKTENIEEQVKKQYFAPACFRTEKMIELNG